MSAAQSTATATQQPTAIYPTSSASPSRRVSAPLKVLRADGASVGMRRWAAEAYMRSVEDEMEMAAAWIKMTTMTPEG